MLRTVTMLFVTLSLLMTIDAVSLHTHQHEDSSQLTNRYQHHHGALPRKLMFNKKVKGYEAKRLVSPNEQNKPYSGESQKNGKEVDVIVHAAKGTRQEWIERSDTTHEFFTMDYSHVRRRRPIHNKYSPKSSSNSP